MSDLTRQNQPSLAGMQHSLVVYRRIAFAFLGLAMIVLLLVFYVVFTKAHVVVLAQQEAVESDFIIDIARDPGPGEVPGDVLEESRSLQETFPVEKGTVVEARATGTVRITSALSRAQTLVETTRLLTEDGRLYRISETVTVPANGSVEVEAYADALGEEMETERDTFTIPGLNPSLRALFTVETVTPIEGGMREVRTVTQQAIDDAAATLAARIEEAVTATLDEAAKAKGLTLEGRDIQTEITEKVASEEPGSEADEFGLRVTVRATGLYFDQAAFARQVEARLKDLVSYDQDLVQVEEDVAARRIEKRDLAAGRANVRVSAHGQSVISPEAPALDPAKLTNVSKEAAVEYLQTIEGISSASITTSPFWSARMPSVADRITVEVR